ncbi:sigma-54-dependent Fis family transcriptional regulator [Desulfovibrio sp. An276]|uniref:sigma-54 interaction domain-containing protein n=1 Tax=Desulfovibrio sp. An276 TaxID=1965618 RepID=UPI000B38F32E|nr:sigma 54-interacting transcriptional regulator [Desulfovibrio sp. An276]OUO52940.1 sigma-54-dependent Fis family transcriptional regulator [Desulfovibrio sp. An276]
MTHEPFKFCEDFERFAEGLHVGLFDLLHTGVALLSNKGVFLYCNKAFLEMFGFTNGVIGKSVTDVFITGERGVMDVIRTEKPVISSSLTVNNEQGISFRYPIHSKSGELCGVVIESIPLSLGKEKLQMLMDTIHNLEEAAQHFEQARSKHVGRLFTFADIVGESAALMHMKQLGQRFAQSNEPILLWGESGSGKELAAQALHMASPRSAKPFVAVNCAALPPDLIESELFGYDAGAFTGARSGGLVGKFELANGGTLFLDEIGELPLFVQAKLLRVLETGEIQKIAHRGPLFSNFRLIGATNRNLQQMVQDGKFREDLYHRINIFEIRIPPLRDRLEDLPLLVRYFVEQILGGSRAKDFYVSREVFELFNKYHWPGNIRELKNVLTYSLYSLPPESNVLTSSGLPMRFIKGLDNSHVAEHERAGKQAYQQAQPSAATAPRVAAKNKKLSEVSAQAEKEAIEQALDRFHYNKSLVAKFLGISRNKLYKKLHDYNLLDK